MIVHNFVGQHSIEQFW